MKARHPKTSQVANVHFDALEQFSLFAAPAVPEEHHPALDTHYRLRDLHDK